MLSPKSCLKILILAAFCMSAKIATAEALPLKETEQLELLLNGVSKHLPPAFRNQWNEILDKQHVFKILKDEKNQRLDQCLRIERKLPHERESVRRSNIRYYEITSNRLCLSSNKFSWVTELRRETARWWFKNLDVKFRSDLVSLVYGKNFFGIYKAYPLNLETDLESMVADFFSLGAHALETRGFLFEIQYRNAAMLIKEVVYNNIRRLADLPNYYIAILPEIGLSRELPMKAKVKMVAKSNEAWFMRYHMIKGAKKSIRLQSYSLFDDLYGRATVALLLEALERGVDVKISLDGRGSILTSRSDLVELLVQKGAKVSSYNPLFWNSINLQKFFYAGPLDGIMSSNHDKILIVDDRKLLTGGRNIGNRYFVMPGEDDGKVYQDMDVYAECQEFPFAAVVAFNIEFYSANAIEVSTILTRANKYNQVMKALQTLEARMFHQNIPVANLAMYPEISRFASAAEYLKFDTRPEEKLHIIGGLDKTSSLLGKNALTNRVFYLVDRAQESITIINPYVILSEGMKQRLISAGKRGVKIIIVTTSPTSTDSKLTQARLIGEWKDILTDIPNLRLFGAKGPTKLHAKSFVFDSSTSIVGSYNLDLLSEKVNSEFALEIYSKDFGKELEGFITDYAFNQSLEYDVAKNIGPHSQPNGQKKFRSMNRLRFLSRIIRPIL